jgi:RNA 2',3'-cyclic 3'-phosphodiesterase
MRLFVAINLTPETRDAIYADAEALRSATTGIRWTAASSLHVTLKFLGEQPESLVPELRAAMEGVSARHRSVDVQTTSFGAFPNFRRPRVVWVGMTGEIELRALANDLGRAFVPLGVAAESREFRAHLTLGRVKGEVSAAESAALSAAARQSVPTRGVPVRTIDLMRSELSPGGSRYSVLVAVPLTVRGT